ncbi:unnamed protein product [Rotaria sp. Silwood2]|nr:unnamed protein product [Rotaria sp. Silwood2]CAF3383484.1 unnamed protein product [Rotaria sp. Silwood2]CAF4243245.1 unnamed protein product [Rotaria sp. Silwood2]CAF4336113.1 unnamed protein product [Rotaria sp. Silwood2]CAF4490641.1 unnamed protein product [Rotaria sp. Silwood2]
MSTEKMSVNGKYIVDKCSRVRIFRGINGVLKYFPWYPYQAPDPPLLDPNYMSNLRDWGFNVIRLGTMWAGAEPLEGQYNETYLSKLKEIVELANNYNIYLFHDMHQDLLTSALKGLDNLSGYDGIPLWLFKKFKPCVDNNIFTCPSQTGLKPCVKYPCPFPPNFDAGGNWFLNYFTSICSSGFQQLYKNQSGAVDSWSKFWVKIAQTFGSYSNVLGYELINEPWFGDFYKDPLLLLPDKAGRENLLPVYNILNQVIRTVDTQSLLFYEPVTYGVFFQGPFLGTGFDTVPGGHLYANLSVLSYHWYCSTASIIPSNVLSIIPSNVLSIIPPELLSIIPPQVLALIPLAALQSIISAILSIIPQDVLTVLSTEASCNTQGNMLFQTVDQDIEHTGGSSFLTEFGFDGRTDTGAQQNYFTLDKCDQYFQSWTVWGMSFLNESSHIQYDILSQFNRPYAYAIAGKPLLMFYDRNNTRCFTLKYTIDLTITCPSLIYLPSAIYPRPNGYSITLTCELESNVNTEDSNLIDIKTTNSTDNGCCAIVQICPS